MRSSALASTLSALALSLPLLAALPGSAQAQNSGQRSSAPADWAEQLQVFAGGLAADPEVPHEWASRILSQARHNSRVKRLMTPSSSGVTVRDWQAYRQRLVNAVRIESGVQFWRRHRHTLASVEARTGVPANVIVGIIGIETSYGQNMGDVRVLDALATLAFDYPPQHPRAQERAQYFRKELAQYLRLARQHGLDPLSTTGSFAGAMGIPQFMPSSWLLYGSDQDGDHIADLIGSPSDAIASVANYLLAHGWRAGQSAYFEIDLHADAQQMTQLLAPDILPTFDVAALQSLGVRLRTDALGNPGNQYGGQMALIELKNGQRAPDYVVGTENFYAVTRYNQSSYYALAVLQLGEAVQQRMMESSYSRASNEEITNQ